MSDGAVTALVIGIVLGAHVLIVLTFVLFMSIVAKPSVVEAVVFADTTCTVDGDEVVVGATIERGPDFASDFFLGVRGRKPSGVPFDSGLGEDPPSLVPGDTIALRAPVDLAGQIDGVEMNVWRGEPGYAQTVPLTVTLLGHRCVVDLG